MPVESDRPFDPFHPPREMVKAAAELLARELMFRGVKPTVVSQPANHAYLVIVPRGSSELMVDVRASFYTWNDPAADHGGRSHAQWGNHANAADRILATARRTP